VIWRSVRSHAGHSAPASNRSGTSFVISSSGLCGLRTPVRKSTTPFRQFSAHGSASSALASTVSILRASPIAASIVPFISDFIAHFISAAAISAALAMAAASGSVDALALTAAASALIRSESWQP
jgi:hypothetical protein